jgi:hypothetical protein
METKQFDHFFERLQVAYGKKYPIGTHQRISKGINSYPSEALRHALEALTLNNNYLPTAQHIIDEVGKQSKRILDNAAVDREISAKAEKEEFRRGAAKAFSEESGIGKESCMLVQAAMSGLMPRRKFLEGIKHLDTKYPNAGFDVVGGKIQQRYKERGYRMDKPSGSPV